MADIIYDEESPDVGLDWHLLPSTLPAKSKKRGELTPGWEKAVTLRAIDGLSDAQIARQIGLSPAAVCKGFKRPWIIKAIQRVQHEYAQQVQPEVVSKLVDIKMDALEATAQKLKERDSKLGEYVATAKAADEMIEKEQRLTEDMIDGEAAKDALTEIDKLSPSLKAAIVKELYFGESTTIEEINEGSGAGTSDTGRSE